MEQCRFKGKLHNLPSLQTYNVYKKRYDGQFSYGWDNKTVTSPLDADRS